MMLRSLMNLKVLALLAGVGILAIGASPAQAGTRWSVGVGFGFGGYGGPSYCGPAYAPAPVYCPPPVVVYRPAPVYYYQPQPVYTTATYVQPVAPAPVVYQSAPVYYAPPAYYPAYSPSYSTFSFSFGTSGGYRPYHHYRRW